MDQPDLKYITRSSVIPWVSNNGLRVDKRTSRTITLRWESPTPDSGQHGLVTWPDDSAVDTDDELVPGLPIRSTGSMPRIRLGMDSIEPIKEKPSKAKPTLYEIQMKKTGAGSWTTIYKGFAKRFEVEDLKPDTNLTFRMRRSPEEEWGTSIMASTDSPPPNAEDLHTAIASNHEAMVLRIIGGCRPTVLKKMLISHNKSGHTPLMTAALNGKPDLVKLLIKVGANVNATALNTEQTALMLGCFKGDLSCVQLLDTAGADWELRDSSGCNPIHHAINGESVKTLKYALSKRGPEAIEERDNSGWTPLLRAIIIGNSAEVVQFLLANGANPNAVDSKNTKSCLMAAVMLGKSFFVTLLLEYNVNINYKNGNEQQAIDIAESKGYMEIVNMLKQALHHHEAGTTDIEFNKILAGDVNDKPEEVMVLAEPSQTIPEPTQPTLPPSQKDPKTDAEYLTELERRLSHLAMQAARNEIGRRENDPRSIRFRNEKGNKKSVVENTVPNKRKSSAKLNQAHLNIATEAPNKSENPNRVTSRTGVNRSEEIKKGPSKISTVKSKTPLKEPSGSSRPMALRRPSEPLKQPPSRPSSARPKSAISQPHKKQEDSALPSKSKRTVPAIVTKVESTKTQLVKSKSIGSQQSAAFAKPTTVIKPRRFSDSPQPTKEPSRPVVAPQRRGTNAQAPKSQLVKA